MKQQQRGGTVVGFILGLMVGLAAALAVAVYVTKVPVPFLNKGQSRTADQDAAEAKKNQGWDPNAPLYGKNPVKPSPAAAAPAAAASPATTTTAPQAPAVAGRPIGGDKPATAEKTVGPGPDPLGDLAQARAAAAASPQVAAAPANPNAVNANAPEPFEYLVQAGAFRTAEDAEAQRAKLAMMGWEARITERDQAGRPVFRVRVGPFARKDDADRLKEKLDAASVESTLVRVQR